jgi:hypothetical protein
MKGGGWINLFRRFNAKEGARSKLNGVSGRLMHEGRSVPEGGGGVSRGRIRLFE